ncbi:MAG: sulfur carrier protein ThiS [Candidatus Methylomirabilales bacterium]
MHIRLNGKDYTLSEGITVAQLLDELKVRPERVAVLVNQGIVKKPSYATTTLREGDAVEVLTVMAGGAWRRSDDGV